MSHAQERTTYWSFEVALHCHYVAFRLIPKTLVLKLGVSKEGILLYSPCYTLKFKMIDFDEFEPS